MEEKMKVISYMKIDYMLTRQQLRIMLPIAIVAVLVGKGMDGMGVMVSCCYMLFVATLFSTAPFGACHRKNTGFLLMLPGTVTERVTGRFLYGLSYIVMTVIICLAGMGVYGLLGHEITRLSVGLFLCNVALSIVIVALEYLISYLFGEGKNNWQYLGNIVRIAPGMGMFFLFMFILRKADEAAYAMDRLVFLTEKIMSAGLVALAAALLIMALAVFICVKVIEKRDYA